MTTYRHAEGGLRALETANLDPDSPDSPDSPLIPPASDLARDADPGLFDSPLASGSHGPSCSRMGVPRINRQSNGNGNNGHGSGSGGDAKSVSWGDLPKKQQLVVLTLARLSEPLVQTSLQSYMFYQLKWFDPSLPDSVISSQAGILQSVRFRSLSTSQVTDIDGYMQRQLYRCPVLDRHAMGQSRRLQSVWPQDCPIDWPRRYM